MSIATRPLRPRSHAMLQPRHHSRTIERMADDDHPLPAPFAAVDLGSNSFRLEIGQFEQGRYRKLERLKETVRLGAGLDADGLLQENAVQRALGTLRRFAA